jgi:transmembrane sensor
VHSYADDPRVMVAVMEGRVAMRGQASTPSPALLNPGDLGVLADHDTVTVQRAVDVRRYRAFADGRLVFVDTPLPEAVVQVQRWYDVAVTVADSSLMSATVTGAFTDEGLTEVLQALATSLDARYVQRGRMVQLFGK